MADRDAKELSSGAHTSRRGLLTCMAWAGTGVLWTLSGGVPRSLGLVGEAMAAEPAAGEAVSGQTLEPPSGHPQPLAPHGVRSNCTFRKNS